jgi:FkbM family methyltransferase
MIKNLKAMFRNLQTFVPWMQDLRFAYRSWVIKYLGILPEDDFYLVAHFTPEPNEVFIDVGANRGDMTLCLLQNKELSNKIIAFEPNGSIFKHTANRTFVRANPRINLLNVGLGNSEGTLTLFTPQYRNWVFDGLSSFSFESASDWLKNGMWRYNENLQTIQKHECVVKRLDSYNFKPYFIKIDVEGFEFEVLKGAEFTIRNHSPLLLVEDITQEIKDWLGAFGYRFFGFDKNRGLYEGTGTLNTYCLNTRHLQSFKDLMVRD